MRWDLYLNQTQGAGVITLAIFLLVFGTFSWWYILEQSRFLAAHKARNMTSFWIVIASLYSIITYLILFQWPEG